MVKTISKIDFDEGGQFHNLMIPKSLPVPREILNYIFQDSCYYTFAKSCEINLLKSIWDLKGIEMFHCLCGSKDHLVDKSQHAEQLKLKHELNERDFQKGGQFEDVEISHRLPLNENILTHLWGGLSYFNQIQDGTCFKGDCYQAHLLQKCYSIKYKKPCFICPCFKHLDVN